MTSSTRNILIGLGLGALVGLFFGEGPRSCSSSRTATCGCCR